MKILRSVWFYGGLMALLIILLRVVEYNVFIRQLHAPWYMGLFAMMFTGVGIWMGWHFFLAPKQAKGEKMKSPVPSGDQALLTERELEILLKMAHGCSNQEIADQLFISIHTVKTHASNIFAKLDVRRRTQAILKAKALGIIREEPL